MLVGATVVDDATEVVVTGVVVTGIEVRDGGAKVGAEPEAEVDGTAFAPTDGAELVVPGAGVQTYPPMTMLFSGVESPTAPRVIAPNTPNPGPGLTPTV